ncbi:hypothetical protein HKX48_005839 [Thoreauomyces humboldtii]|nr:hypothetical protein HKX48_005839 [Thoreauomyces humboldtii]
MSDLPKIDPVSSEATASHIPSAALAIDDTSRPSDEEILRFEKSVKASHAEADLVGPPTGFDELAAEYQHGHSTAPAKISSLASTHSALRRTRRDGNCFYRAVAFRYCELITAAKKDDPAWATVVIRRMKDARKLVEEAGYDLHLLVDFAEMFEEAVESGDAAEAGGDGTVCWLRLVTAAVLKNHRDLFEAFILDSYPSLNDFIASQVEPMNIEADQPHIVAIATALGVDIRIGNLDASATTDGAINWHEISPLVPLDVPAGGKTPLQVELLFRPGHYDIIYPK